MSQSNLLLVNLGTPAAPTVPAIRRFLSEFLHDWRVIDISRWIWCWILHGVILRIRPRKLVAKYQSVWTPAGSPLLVETAKLAESLQPLVDARVVYAMRYGEPSITQALDALGDIEQLTILPLYPQYSATTTASVFDGVAKAYQKRANLPNLHFVRDYHAHPAYIAALAQSVRAHWAQQGRGEKLMLSLHGIPQRYVAQGDPYQTQCERSARLLAQALELDDSQWALTYQSRVGREVWLQPYTDATLIAWAQAGVKTVDVICPGFAVDCLETLEEISIENSHLFVENGGQALRYIPCLNGTAAHAAMLAAILKTDTALSKSHA